MTNPLGGGVVLFINTGTKTRTNILNLLGTLIHIALPLLTQTVPSRALFIIMSTQIINKQSITGTEIEKSFI